MEITTLVEAKDAFFLKGTSEHFVPISLIDCLVVSRQNKRRVCVFMVQWVLRRFPLLFRISIYCRKVWVLRLQQKHHLDDQENYFFVLRRNACEAAWWSLAAINESWESRGTSLGGEIAPVAPLNDYRYWTFTCFKWFWSSQDRKQEELWSKEWGRWSQLTVWDYTSLIQTLLIVATDFASFSTAASYH